MSTDDIFPDESKTYEEKLIAKKNIPLVVNKLHIRGCVKTNEKYVRSLFQPAQEAHTLQELLEAVSLSVEKLQRNGVLTSAVATCVPAEVAGAADVVIEIVEDQSTHLSTNTYIQNGKTTLETEFTKKNVFGNFENYSVKGSIGNDTSNSVDVSFVKPNVFLSHDATAKVFHFTSINQLMQSHDLKTTGVSLNFNRDALSNSLVSSSLTIGCQNRNVTNLPTQASKEIRHLAGASLKSYIEHRFTRNTTDSPTTPSRGSIIQIINEIAVLGSEHQFLKSQGAATLFYKPFKHDIIFGLDLKCGYIHSLGSRSSAVPLPDRFLLGGPGSLWGFEMNSVGPTGKHTSQTGVQPLSVVGFPQIVTNKSSSDAIGGNVLLNGNFNISSPIPKSPIFESLGARAQIFLNAGNLMNTSGDETLNAGFERFINSTKLAYGFGLKVPFLTGRVDLAWSLPLLSNSRDQNRFFQFGFTQSFK
eukprot:c13206_g2_i1.p1 GENE.c13206_g2_i1~~c13206_g2_i1.p1  ORF type:complete len:480 (+),score=173.82 c13206_g2_i1:22-1440(+)